LGLKPETAARNCGPEVEFAGFTRRAGEDALAGASADFMTTSRHDYEIPKKSLKKVTTVSTT
jgi:hypothetical protein